MSFLKLSTLRSGILACSLGGLLIAPEVRAQGLDGALAGDRFGEAVAWMGDVNDDGFDDFAVGSPMGTGAAGRAGLVLIYLGVPGAVPGSPARILEGEVSGDEFGFAISRAGDLNADGYDDILVGAPGNNGAGLDAGRAYLFLGGASPASAPAASWDGDLPGSRFGASLAGGFDFNLDGHPDFAVAAPNYSGGATRRGLVKIYLGSTAVLGITQPAAYAIAGDQANWNLGFSLRPAGDLNDDGRGDLVAGAPQRFDLNPGLAVVWFGRASATFPPLRQVLVGTVGGDRFGWSVAAAGDFDHDLHDDLVVGAPGHDSLGSDKGAIYLFRGGPAFDAANDGVAIGATGGDSLGYAVDGGFDRTGDGIPDIAAGAPGADGAGASAGEVRVFRGGVSLAALPDTVLLPDPPIPGFEADDRFGAAVRFAASIDGDPLADLVAGAPSGNAATGATAGYADVFRGADGTVPVRVLSFDVSVSPEGALIVWNLAGAEDLAGVRLSAVRGDLETAIHAGWLPPGSGSYLDRDRNPAPSVYRLWGLDRAGGTTLLAEAAGGSTWTPRSRFVASPNPFRSGVMLSVQLPAGPIRVRIFDAGGRVVRRFLEVSSAPDPVRIAWDGRDDAGRPAPAGVYVVRADGGEARAVVGRIVRLP